MTNDQLTRKYTKMSSSALLAKVVKGGFTIREAKIAATIVEKRFPTPVGIQRKSRLTKTAA